MPNHFHFLIKPTKENSISLFLSEISNSYTKYFNIKNKRIGSLFQGTFKSKEANKESVLQLSRYIHLNPIFSSKANLNDSLKKPENYLFSSYREWIKLEKLKLVDKQELSEWLKIAGGIKNYQKFLESMVDKNPKIGIERLTIEWF